MTVGATNGLFLSLWATLNRPDSRPRDWEVVVLEPFFELYRAQVAAVGARLRTVPMRFDEASHAFELDVEALQRALGPSTGVLIVNTPHNPTGKAFAESELHAIADLVRRSLSVPWK